MNRELLRALGLLVRLGRMTEDEALGTLIEEAADEFAPLIDALHNVACVKKHACDITHLAKRTAGVCYYELESQVHECWSLSDHKKWLKTFCKIALEVGYENIQEIMRAIGALNANAQLIAAKSPTAKAIAEGLCAAVLSSPLGHPELECPTAEPE